MMSAFFVRFAARSSSNFCSEGASIARMCRWPISPLLSLSTISRRSFTHFAYCRSANALVLSGAPSVPTCLLSPACPERSRTIAFGATALRDV